MPQVDAGVGVEAGVLGGDGGLAQGQRDLSRATGEWRPVSGGRHLEEQPAVAVVDLAARGRGMSAKIVRGGETRQEPGADGPADHQHQGQRRRAGRRRAGASTRPHPRPLMHANRPRSACPAGCDPPCAFPRRKYSTHRPGVYCPETHRPCYLDAGGARGFRVIYINSARRLFTSSGESLSSFRAERGPCLSAGNCSSYVGRCA